MTRLWPDGSPIRVAVNDGDQPLRFTWRGQTHEVDTITREWRVRTDWWRGGAWRAYFRLTTSSGLLVVIFHDLADGEWFLQRLFD